MIERDKNMTEGKNLDTFGIDKFADRISHSKLVKSLFLGTAVVGGAELMNACTPPPAETAPLPSSTASTESPYVKYTPTSETTVEPTSMPTPTRPDMAGGAYNEDQKSMIESGNFAESEKILSAWTKYWSNAENNPFHPETTDLHFKYVFDGSSKSAGVCLESSAYQNVCFAPPIINGEVATVPPTVSADESYEIPVGYGPLEMSLTLNSEQVSTLKLDESLTDSVLGFENGSWVRIKNGEVVGTLDLESVQWKIKDKYEIDMEKLQNFPKSAQEVISNPEKFQQAPDGVADPQALLDWYYNKLVPMMGDQTKLTPNLKISNRVTDSDIINVNIIPKDRQQMIDNPDFFYFKHGEELYVVPVLTLIDSRGYNFETFALILSDSSVLDSLVNNTNKISQINMFASEKDYITDDQNKMVNGGINGATSETHFRIATAELLVIQ